MTDINGTAGNDSLLGSNGDDKIFGLAGNDVLQGFRGNDTLSGGANNDILFGFAGNDTLRGGSGNDTLVGTDPRNPTLTGDETDTLIGGSGADRFVLGNGFGVFYAEPDIRSADIRDFRSSDGDKIVLKGSASDYILNTGFVPNGTAIFTVNGQSLIAEVQGVTNLSFASDFNFVV